MVCVVIGGDDEDRRRSPANLLDAGAEVRIRQSTLNDALRQLTSSGKIVHRVRSFRAPDAEGAMLVMNTLKGDREYARSLYELALKGISCCARPISPNCTGVA